MGLQVRRRLGVADGITLVNAGIGIVAAVVAVSDPAMGARLVLLAAVADALDGIVARKAGSTEVGPLLDSVTDVVSFGATPAILVYGITQATYGGLGTAPRLVLAAALLVGWVFVALSIVRTALYTVYVEGDEPRPGIQNTLAATVLAAGYLAGVTAVPVVLAATVVLSVLMVVPVTYPKLLARDAFVLGVVQGLAILAPTALSRAFPRALLVAALAYLVLAPRYYWRQE